MERCLAGPQSRLTPIAGEIHQRLAKRWTYFRRTVQSMQMNWRCGREHRSASYAMLACQMHNYSLNGKLHGTAVQY